MSFIYVPFSYLMKLCLAISGNHYIFALFFFALLMEIVLLPLAIKQQKNQIKMAEVRPKEMAIREKYKGRNDRVTQQKMTMEIQEMYQQSGYSQFSGCLPLLIQLPIIFIVFAIVRQPLTYASEIKDFDIVSQSKAAVEFYQAEKDLLIKDSEDYAENLAMLEGYQTDLGVEKVTDKTASDAFKFYIGETEYTPSGAGAYNEMALSRLIIDGEDDIKAMIEDGEIDASILDIYYATGFKDYRDDLPNYRIGSVNLIEDPELNGGDPWLLLIPLFVFLTSFLSTKITRKFTGAAMQTDANGNPIGGGLFMEVGMPLMSAMFSFSFASAVGCYWVWRTLIGMIKTVIVAKAMPIPVVTEEQIAEARKEIKAKAGSKKKKVITIEVDEDDDSYDSMIVEKAKNSSKPVDPTKRVPRKIEMLTADDEDDAPANGNDD